MNQVLEEHLRAVATLLKAYYESSKQMKAPINLGVLRERFARELLRLFLPTTHEIQRGEIIDSSGMRTRQQDIIIYRRDMPKLRVIEEPAILFTEGSLNVAPISMYLNNMRRQKLSASSFAI